MGRPTVIDDQKLLEVARDVFLRRGVGATTAEVAKKAGISQASVFKHFKSKQRLFFAAMKAEQQRQDWAGLFERTREARGLEEAMIQLGIRMVAFFLNVLPLALLIWSTRGAFGGPEGITTDHAGPMRALHELVATLDAQMRAGRLTRHDPWIVARAFAGSMQSYALLTHLFKPVPGPAFTPEEYVRGVVHALFLGVTPRKAGPS